MKKILYITANTKPQEQSTSRTVGRLLVNQLQKQCKDATLEELDLYQTHLPVLKYHYFSGRSTLISSDQVMKLSTEEQEDIRQVEHLCDQFIAADCVVLAAPMWSLSYPAVVKQYLDCILMSGKTLGFKDEKPYGLLDDRNRSFAYVQSSGASLPWMLRPILNKGMSYVEDIMKFIGINGVYSLFADGTGTTETERREAISKAAEKTEELAEEMLKNIGG